MGRAKNIGIFCRQQPAVKREILAGLTEWLRKQNHEVLMPPETAAILGETSSCEKSEIPSRAQHIIVLGGDGTLLTVARTAYPYKIPITAVNLGSLGFLTEFSLPGLYEGLEKILNGDFSIEKRMLLNVAVQWGNQRKNEYHALNEVVISRGSLSRILSLEVHVNGQYMTSYRADGLIIATPTGSTAHSLSAGGPILHPGMDALVITPICSFTLTNRPIVIPAPSEIKVRSTTGHEDVRITLDGQEGCDLGKDGVVTVKKAENHIQLVQAPGNNFYQILRNKLHWGKETNING